jgi:hypothetical protein
MKKLFDRVRISRCNDGACTPCEQIGGPCDNICTR